jgi:hypothetical protein
MGLRKGRELVWGVTMRGQRRLNYMVSFQACDHLYYYLACIYTMVLIVTSMTRQKSN